jgi:hypothetical protein
MQITITRSREAQKAVNHFRKGLKMKGPQRKMAFFGVVGVGLFAYSYRGMIFDNYVIYGLIGTLCIGAALMIYFENFYPKVSPDARLAMKGYHEMENPLNFKIELTDQYFANEAGDYYSRLGWGIFHAFKIEKQCILLFTGHSNHSGVVVIRKKELTTKELEEFCSFLKKKMAQIR